MKLMINAAVVLGLVLVGVSWIGQNVNDSGFRQDIAFIPALIDNRNGATASSIANAVRHRAEDHGIVIGPDDLHVDVSAPKQGHYDVVGGAVHVKGPAGQLIPIQDVSIRVTYERKFLKLFTRHISTTVDTTSPGSGPASSYPPSPDAPAVAPPLAQPTP